MSKQLTKYLSILLTICLFSSSVFAAATPIPTYAKTDFTECLNNNEHHQEEVILPTDQLLSEVFESIPYRTSAEYVQSQVRNIYPNAIVMDIQNINNPSAFVESIAVITESQTSGSAIANLEELTQLIDYVSDLDVEGYITIWHDENTNELNVSISLWCALCQLYVSNPVFRRLVNIVFDAIILALLKWLVEQILCAAGHILEETKTLESIEYAPRCGNCALTVHMVWEGYLRCTACTVYK